MNGAPSESDSERDGAFSYSAEWHAFSHGVYHGFTTKPLSHPDPPDRDDVQKEPAYYRGGYVTGSVLQAMVAVTVAVATFAFSHIV